MSAHDPQVPVDSKPITAWVIPDIDRRALVVCKDGEWGYWVEVYRVPEGITMSRHMKRNDLGPCLHTSWRLSSGHDVRIFLERVLVPTGARIDEHTEDVIRDLVSDVEDGIAALRYVQVV